MDYRMDECAGCSTCSVACSYRHTKEFNPEIASMEIVERSGIPRYFVRIHTTGNGNRIPCDGCLNVEGEPLCVVYCPKKKILMEIIEKHRGQL